MKKKLGELRGKTKTELLKLLAKKRQEQVLGKMEQSALKLKNVKKISQIRKEIARILTLIKEKEIS